MKFLFVFRALLLYFFILQSTTGLSQLHINYPVDRMVIQRSIDNYADIQIAGYTDQRVDRIEARLVPRIDYQGTETPWVTIENIPSNSQFIGTINGRGGWYKLEVRAYLQDQIIDKQTIEHVGIGEVFLISGQSNAEGNKAFGGEAGTEEDRVSVINYKEPILDEDKLPFEFNQLKDYSNIGPYNPVPWFWVKLAEKIVAQYNVPVLLLGAAVGGMGSELWYGSMKGIDYTHTNATHVKFYGSPYAVIQKTLQNYVSRTGLRAILWQQGESDAGTFANVYIDRMKEIVNQTSIDIDDKVNWIMAVSSRTPHVTHIAYAQQNLIDTQENIFQGPNTDYIVGSAFRADGIHFTESGLDLAAAFWFEAIKTENLLDKIQPIKPKPFFKLNVGCSDLSEKKLNLSIPEGFTDFKWSDLNSTPFYDLNYGTISAKAKRNGVVYFSPSIQYDANEFRKEEISLNGFNTFCDGVTTNTLNSTAEQSTWLDGQKGKQIVPTQSGDYYFTWKNRFGCDYNSENITIDILPKPEPQLSISSGQNRFCDNEEVTVATTSAFSAYNWSTGFNTPSVNIDKKGDYFLLVKSEQGCESDTLQFALETVPAPAAPVIQNISPFQLEISDANENPLNHYKWFANENDMANSNSTIKITEPGAYRVQTKILYQSDNNPDLYCYSEFSNIIQFREKDFIPTIKIWPNPASDYIQIEMLEDNGEDLNLFLYSADGKLLDKAQIIFENELPKYNLKNLPKGTYFIKVGTRSNYVTHKIIISK